MSELPQGWEWTTIGDVLAPLEDGRTIHQGWSPKCETHPAPDEAWGVLKTTAIQPGVFHPEHNKALPAALEPRPVIEVRDGDLLLTCAGPRARCGVACLVTSTRPRLMLSGKMYRFRVNESQVNTLYLAAYLQTAQAWSDIDTMKTGGSDSGLNLTQTRFRQLAVPVAPRPEQQRIVAAIEEHLSRLHAAEAALSSARRRTEALGWRVLRVTLQQEADWPEVAMREIAQLSLGKMLDKKQQNGLHPTGYLRNINVRWGSFDLTDIATMDVSPKELDRASVSNGDVVMCEGGEPGRCAVWRADEPIAIQKALHRIRPIDSVLPDFLAMVFKQMSWSGELRSHFTGTTIKHLPKERLAEITIRLPPQDVQAEAIARAKVLQAASDRLAEDVMGTEQRSKALRQSMLAAAFSGQLVQQDPDDEPASVLLDRIRAEREAASSTRKRRGRS